MLTTLECSSGHCLQRGTTTRQQWRCSSMRTGIWHTNFSWYNPSSSIDKLSVCHTTRPLVAHSYSKATANHHYYYTPCGSCSNDCTNLQTPHRNTPESKYPQTHAGTWLAPRAPRPAPLTRCAATITMRRGRPPSLHLAQRIPNRH